MIRNKIYIIAIVTALMGTSVVHAQQITTNDVIKTKILDWYIPPDVRASSLYKNSKKCGNISFDVMGGSYTKGATFCLFNDKKTKQLCGFGNPQYIPSQKQLGTTKFDYTPILIKILDTAKFLDD